MPTRVALWLVAGLVVAGLVAASLVRGHGPQTPLEWLGPIGPSVAIAAAGLWLFDRVAWRWPIVHRLHGRPVIHGTWHGELVSDWIDPATGQQTPADANVFLVVRQRFWHVAAILLTEKSVSRTLTASLVRHGGQHQLAYIFENEPRALSRDVSRPHKGAAVLVVASDAVASLEGSYFTERKTCGEMTFRERYGSVVDSYKAACMLVDER